MAIVINGWRPDTCGCEIHYSFDSEVPEAEREHSLHVVKTACEAHAHLDHPELYDKVIEENSTKNDAISVILESFPDHTHEVVDALGNQNINFLPGKEPTFSFDADRTLQILTPVMTDSQKEQAQSLIDAAIGVDKVEVK